MCLACFRFAFLGDMCSIAQLRVQFAPTLACIVLALALGDQLVVDKAPYGDVVVQRW